MAIAAGLLVESGSAATRSAKWPGLLIFTGLIGDWPCLAVTMNKVDSKIPSFSARRSCWPAPHPSSAARKPAPLSGFRNRPCSHRAAVDGWIGIGRAAHGRSCPWYSFCPTLTAWKFMPKTVRERRGPGAVVGETIDLVDDCPEPFSDRFGRCTPRCGYCRVRLHW